MRCLLIVELRRLGASTPDASLQANAAGSGGLELGVLLTRELRRLGPAFEPRLLEDRGHLRVGQKVLVALLVPVKEAPQTLFYPFILGSRKTCEPFEPCCFRLRPPLVENVFQKALESLDPHSSHVLGERRRAADAPVHGSSAAFAASEPST